jgi:hypothetical protein
MKVDEGGREKARGILTELTEFFQIDGMGGEVLTGGI